VKIADVQISRDEAAGKNIVNTLAIFTLFASSTPRRDKAYAANDVMTRLSAVPATA